MGKAGWVEARIRNGSWMERWITPRVSPHSCGARYWTEGLRESHCWKYHTVGPFLWVRSPWIKLHFRVRTAVYSQLEKHYPQEKSRPMFLPIGWFCILQTWLHFKFLRMALVSRAGWRSDWCDYPAKDVFHARDVEQHGYGYHVLPKPFVSKGGASFVL